MKRFVGAVTAAFMILLAVLAAIPYGLAAAMKSVFFRKLRNVQVWDVPNGGPCR